MTQMVRGERRVVPSLAASRSGCDGVGITRWSWWYCWQACSADSRSSTSSS